ncbi:MAG: flagellar M-ring protein FliF [Acidobacteria bacterium]|nr:flagellar M-ring protein FliF [Acidobacteriota bacterium]
MGALWENLSRFAAQLAALWRSLPPRRKVAIAAVAALVIALLGGFVWKMNQVAWRPLYAGMTEADAGLTARRLDEMQVPYKLAAGGTTILVPEGRLDDVRLQLAADGLPQSGRLGFELFDENSFGATEFAEQINFRRALEGELERTIARLREVKSARVHISLPQRSVFLDQDRPAKASVVLDLERNQRLGEEQTRAIAALTASAVEGLDPDAVTIMDSTGRLFSQRYLQGGELTDQQIEYRRRLEAESVRKIVETLEPRLGPGGVRANVYVDVDWDSGEQTEEILDPDAIAMSVQKSAERSLEVAPAGVPGTPANLPPQPAQPATTAPDGVERTQETTNYQTSRTVTRMSLERGQMKRMSIAVLVDYAQKVDEEARAVVRVPREAAELETIRELVVAAAGAVESRGDRVTVESLPFTMLEPPLEPPAPPPDPADELFSMEWIDRYKLHFALGLVVLILLAVAITAFRRHRKKAKIRAERQRALEAERERKLLEDREVQDALDRKEEEARMLKGLQVAPLPTSKTEILKKHLETVAFEDPERFARLVKAWVHEDD